MKAKILTDNGNEQWYSFKHKGQTYLMVVGITDKPFRGVSDINGIYEEEQQNEFAKLPNNVVSEAYAEVLGESVNHV